MPAIVERWPPGSTTTSSPGAHDPARDLAGVGAVVRHARSTAGGSPTARGSARRSGCGRRRCGRARGGRAAAAPGTRASSRERSTTLSPSSAEIGMKVTSGISRRAAKRVELLDDLRRRPPRSNSTRSILLTHTTTCGIPSSELMNAWRLDCATTPLRASTSTIARSAVEAPVTMLRVYCSWPGVSAMMNRRCGGREVAVGDVDRDALLALGAQAVGQQRQVEDVVAACAGSPARRARAGRASTCLES